MPARRTTVLVATAALLAGLVSSVGTGGAQAEPAPAAAATAAEQRPRPDLRQRVERLPGVEAVREREAPQGFRYFVIRFRQPIDHARPDGRTFLQRVSLLHRGTGRPTVLQTSGYDLFTEPYRSEPTEIVDGNQLSFEHRFFAASRPERPQWERQLTIRQAATDQHRLVRSFTRLYSRPWLSTGASKGGMTSVYHRRFFPEDVAGTIAYVAPNDVVDDEDVYAEFLGSVGTAACREALIANQRRVLGSGREWFYERTLEEADRLGLTARVPGGPEVAYETAAVDSYFAFWQYQRQRDCADVPARDASRRAVWSWFEDVLPLTGYFDPFTQPVMPYYFQAAAQLGAPTPWERPVADLLRHPGGDLAETFVPGRLRPTSFDDSAMPDIDRWVRTESERMLFLDGENDPWSAEPFDCGDASRARAAECHRYVVPRGNHGSWIADLTQTQQRSVTRRIMAWAGLRADDPARSRAESATPLGVPGLDWRDVRRMGVR